jgi:hypothetical protein
MNCLCTVQYTVCMTCRDWEKQPNLAVGRPSLSTLFHFYNSVKQSAETVSLFCLLCQLPASARASRYRRQTGDGSKCLDIEKGEQ